MKWKSISHDCHILISLISLFYEMNLLRLLLLPSLCFAIGHPSGQTPDVSRLSVNQVSYHGSGCPPNSMSTQLSTDGKSLTLSYARLGAHYKDCQIRLTIAQPHGWHYSILSTAFKGPRKLLQGATAVFHTVYDFDNPSSKVFTKAVAEGRGVEGFFASSETEKTVWSTCGDPTAISIDTNVEMDEGGGDDAVEQTVILKWRRC